MSVSFAGAAPVCQTHRSAGADKSNVVNPPDFHLMTAFRDHANRELVCHAIKDQLEELAVKRSLGALSEEAFIAAVLEIEAKQVTPTGLTLTASQTRGGWTLFKLKIDGTNETCAAFEFLPETGQFRRGEFECDE